MSVCISFSLITQFFFTMCPGCVHLLLCVISCLHCLVFVFHLSTRLIKMSMYSYYYLILVSICVLLYLIFFRMYFSKCQQWIYAQEVNRLAMKQFQANGDDINHHYLLCHRRGRLKNFMFWDENTNLYVSLKFLAECFRLKHHCTHKIFIDFV